jgi:hypothetical protein
MHEDYFLWVDVIPLQANVTKYNIPYRAIGNKLRDVSFQDGNGNLREMTRIGIGDLPTWNNAYGSNTQVVYAFFIQNNQICLVPEVNTSLTGYLKVSYYIRPNSLVLLEAVAPITSIDRNTGVLTVSNLPANYNTNQKYDLVTVKSPHRCSKIELSVLSVSTLSNTITLDVSDIPAELEVGDHVCLATESAIPQIPSDLHVVLAHRVVTRCLEALGDSEGLSNANQKLAEYEVKMMPIIDNRVEDAPRRISNRHSLLRNGFRRGWRR